MLFLKIPKIPKLGTLKWCDFDNVFCSAILDSIIYMGSSTETVAFQMYEILKIDHEFLQFF